MHCIEQTVLVSAFLCVFLLFFCVFMRCRCVSRETAAFFLAFYSFFVGVAPRPILERYLNKFPRENLGVRTELKVCLCVYVSFSHSSGLCGCVDSIRGVGPWSRHFAAADYGWH